jgi:Protein of unknown function (DUF2934)
MARASGGQRKTKNKAKVISPKRAQADDQLVREPPSSTGSNERELSGGSRTSSLTEAGTDRVTSGLSQGVDLGRDDEGREAGIKSAEDEGARFSPDPAQEETMGQIHGEEIHRRITERAFLLYAEGGFRHGYDLDHWLEAERDIMIRHRVQSY